MSTAEFNEKELSFIKSRIEIELDWGKSVYDDEDMAIMASIVSKIENSLNKE